MSSFSLYSKIKGFGEVKNNFSDVKMYGNDCNNLEKSETNNINDSNKVNEQQICQSDAEIFSFDNNREDTFSRSSIDEEVSI